MKFSRLPTLIVFIIFCFPVDADSGMFGPSNLYECILKNMPGAKNDQFAQEVYRKCVDKFPNDRFQDSVKPEKKRPIFGIKTTGECILKHTKDVTSPKGARMIAVSCDILYPDE